MNKSAIERGMFRSVAFKLYRDEEKKSGNLSEEILKPEKNTTMSYKSHLGYHCIDEDGLPKVSMAVGGNDIVIGKIVNIPVSTSDITKAKLTHRDMSTSIKSTDSGVIDNVVLTTNEEGRKMTKIRVRSIRIPEAGDKFASRAGQKGTVGLILPQEEMPFTSQGIVPDIIINPHCFVGETLVSCPGGLSRRIDSLSEQGLESVWSWDDSTKKCYASFSLGMTKRGVQDVLGITFEDGRVLRCTPDHKIKILKGRTVQWKQAKDLTFQDDIVIGLRGTEDVRCSKEPQWQLETGDYKFDFSTEHERERSLAFARLLGYLYTDGCIGYYGKSRWRAILYMGTLFDCDTILKDVKIVTGADRKPLDYCSKTLQNCKTFNIELPGGFARSLSYLPGITLNRRTAQAASYPEFLSQEGCPVSILREFLGGLFGGDGWSPYIKDKKFSRVAFSQSIDTEFKDSLVDKMNLIIRLLAKVGVKSKIVRTRPNKSGKQVQCEMEIESNLEFLKCVGFRHCIEKQLRLDVAASFEGYWQEVSRQYKVSYQVAASSKTNHEAKRNIKNLYHDELPLSQYYSLLNPELCRQARKGQDAPKIKVSYLCTGMQWLEKHNAANRFAKGYLIGREDMQVPTFTMKVAKIERHESADVYDIGVAHTHNFQAEGVVVSNCIPSRMTVGQLFEAVIGKHKAVTGETLADATVFNKLDTEGICKALHSVGYQKHGNEVMYHGATGKPIKSMIFIGPTYYQRLKHLVADKIHSRSRGLVTNLYRQPMEGRSRDGGLRFGEMEKDATLAHGAMTFLREKMLNLSDRCSVPVCNNCGIIAIYNKKKADTTCRGCGSKDISMCVLPYVCKLLFQDLMAMNIAPRISVKQN